MYVIQISIAKPYTVIYLFQARYPSMTFIKVIICILIGTCSGRVSSFPQLLQLFLVVTCHQPTLYSPL